MSNVKEIVELVARLQTLAKQEWGNGEYECDCSHETCDCECYMCTNGWSLTEMAEIHEWERHLLPIVTSRNPEEFLK